MLHIAVFFVYKIPRFLISWYILLTLSIDIVQILETYTTLPIYIIYQGCKVLIYQNWEQIRKYKYRVAY